MLFCVALSSETEPDPRCHKWKIRLQNRCLKRGFPSNVTSCDTHFGGMISVGELFWTKKMLRKCKRIHKLVKKHCSVYCSYTMKTIGRESPDLDKIDMTQGFIGSLRHLEMGNQTVNRNWRTPLLWMSSDRAIVTACNQTFDSGDKTYYWIRLSSKPNSNSFHFARMGDEDVNDMNQISANLDEELFECQEMKEQLSTSGGVLRHEVVLISETVVKVPPYP